MTAHESTFSNISIKESRINGRGCFAARPFLKDECIGEYDGDLLTDKEADRRYEGEEVTYLFSLDNGKIIDGRNGNGLQYANHSCDPNCYVRIKGNRIFYYASRPIAKDEELTIDYHFDDERMHPCACGADTCRGFMNRLRTEKFKKV